MCSFYATWCNFGTKLPLNKVTRLFLGTFQFVSSAAASPQFPTGDTGVLKFMDICFIEGYDFVS